MSAQTIGSFCLVRVVDDCCATVVRRTLRSIAGAVLSLTKNGCSLQRVVRFGFAPSVQRNMNIMLTDDKELNELVQVKLKRLETLMKDAPEEASTTGAFRRRFQRFQTPKATFAKKMTFVKEKGIKRLREMLSKIKEIGYNVEPNRITQAGVLSLKGNRDGYPVFGFVCPTGKLRLSMRKEQVKMYDNSSSDVILEINYQRKNLVVHDHFLTIVVNRV